MLYRVYSCIDEGRKKAVFKCCYTYKGCRDNIGFCVKSISKTI